MNQVKNFDDVNREFRTIQKFMDSFKGASLGDLKGKQIKNVGEGKDPSDVVTVSQLPVVSKQTFTYRDYRTILWSNPGVLYTGTPPDETISDLEWYRFGRFMSSKPIEFWVQFVTPPSSESAIFQLSYRLTDSTDPEDILIDNLEIQVGATEGVQTASFTVPVKTFAERSCIRPRVVQHGEIAIVSIGLIVERKI